MTPSEIEKAKLRANYWNGLAIATMAIGALPLVVGLDVPTEDFDFWAYALRAVSSAFLAYSLSRLFHTLALRSVSGF